MKSRKPRKSRKCRRGRRKSDGKCKRKPGPKSKRRRKPRKSHKCSRKTRKSHKCSRKTRKFDIKKSNNSSFKFPWSKKKKIKPASKSKLDKDKRERKIAEYNANFQPTINSMEDNYYKEYLKMSNNAKNYNYRQRLEKRNYIKSTGGRIKEKLDDGTTEVVPQPGYITRRNRIKSIKFRMSDVGEEVDEVHIWGHGWDIGEVFQIPEGIQSITYLKDIDSRYYEDHQANYMETKYTNDYIPNMLIAFLGASDSFPMKITINDKSIAIPDSLEPLSNLSTYILNIAKHKVKIIVHACRVSDISGLDGLPISKNAKDLFKRAGKLQEIRKEKTRDIVSKAKILSSSSTPKYVPPHLRFV